MSSLFDDDELGASANARTQQNLSSLFSGDSGGNQSLSYQAPKQPKRERSTSSKDAPVDTGTPALLQAYPIVLNRYDTSS